MIGRCIIGYIESLPGERVYVTIFVARLSVTPK